MKRAVLSCLNQEYDNFTVVISDDGSTDSTPIILANLQKKYPEKLKVILNEKNQGITKNCNVSLSACKAELVAICAGDDVLYPTKIRQQVLEFEKNKNLVLCYHPSHVVKNGGIVGTIGHRKMDDVNSYYDIISNYGSYIPASSVMVARKAIPEYGFNENLPTASDWMFYIDIASKGDVLRIDPILSQYRLHEGNVGKKLFQYMDDFLKTLDIVSEKYGADFNIDRCVRKGRRRFLLGILYNSAEKGDLKVYNKMLDVYKEFGYLGYSFLYILQKSWVRKFLPGLKPVLKKIV